MPLCAYHLTSFFRKSAEKKGRQSEVSDEEPKAGKRIDGGVLEQAQYRLRNTLAQKGFDIRLNAFSATGHLLIGLGLARLLFLSRRNQFPAYA